MLIDKFLDKLNNHTKVIYENEIEQVIENGKNINWLLGLAGTAIIFSFNKYEAIDSENFYIIFIQFIIFISIIVVGYVHRIKTKSFRDHTISMIRMFDFLKIEFELVPDEIEDEFKTEKFDTIFYNYLNGEYFNEEDRKVFDEISKNQNSEYKVTKTLTILSIILMVLQFGCFFVIII